MRIALLCMSVEPGQDGVGDYVRQFARTLNARGHACQVVALADRFVGHPTVGADPSDGYEVVRIPAQHWRQADISVAIERLMAFAPDWVSLQMVCYGYEERGLLWRSARQFARLHGTPKRHMMFHELWVGAGRESRLKDRLVGWLQRKLILRATHLWSPRIVHTSNPFYREMLRRADINAEELALPGNIPVRPLDHASARAMLIRRLEERPQGAFEPLLAGIFGSFHPQWSDGNWLARLSALGARLRRRLVIVQLGRLGAESRQGLAPLFSQIPDNAEFLEFGELPASEISAVLHGLDFGVSTTPWPLIGKSGTAAAMLEHGLPVLVLSEGSPLRNGQVPTAGAHPQLFRLDDFCSLLERNAVTRVAPQARADVYETFIGALERAS